MKALGSRAFDDIDLDIPLRTIRYDGRVVAAIHPRLRHAWMLSSQIIQNLFSTSGILHRRSSDDHNKQEAQHIGGDVPLPDLDLFACINSLAGLTDIARRFDTLGVNDRRSRGRRPAFRDTDLLAQQIMQGLGRAVDIPLRIVVIHRLVRREVVRQVRPRDPGPAHVQNRVDDLAKIMHPRRHARPAPRGTPCRQRRLDQRPSGIGQVAGVRAPDTHKSIKISGAIRNGQINIKRDQMPS